MVPKLAITPAPCEAAMPSALRVAPASSRRSTASAAATPIGPKAPVGCQPLA